MPNLATFIDVNARYHRRPAVVFPARDESISYQELRDRVHAIGAGLRELGIHRGDRVCIFLDTSPEYLIAYLAIWRIGAIAVPANAVFRERELLHAVADAGAVAVITDENGAGVVSRIRADSPTLVHVVAVGDHPSATASWEVFLAEGKACPAEHCILTDLCQLQYTAGTTGEPKGTMLTHGNWMAALDAEREVLSLRPEDVYLGIYPLGHVGFSWGLAVLKAGATFVMLERFDPDRYLSLVREHRVTVLASMPPVIHTLVHAPPGTEEKLATVRVMISGGGPLFSSTWEAFDRRYRIPIANAYGLSETIVVGSATCVLPAHYGLHQNYRSVGAPVGYAEVKVVDPENPAHELATRDVGEIAVRGPAVASGYWGRPEATAEVFRPDGWFLTGDLGYLDEDGALAVTDRKKDMICMSGWKIYPAEVENVLVQHPAIADAAVFGRPDERRGEIPVAAVVLRDHAAFTHDDLVTYCKDRLSGYKCPRETVVLDALPRVNGWKLLRRKLREEFGTMKGDV